MENEKTILTDDQVEYIAKEMDESIKGTPLADIANLPSNQGKEERSKDEISESGEARKMTVLVDPNTGENKIIGPASDRKESFDEICERLKDGNININVGSDPFSENELKESLKTSFENLSSKKDYSISDDATRELLFIVNRKKNNEEFNVYKAFPQEVKDIVDKYLEENGMGGNSMQCKQTRNLVSESLLNEFISNIELNRIQSDFNKEIEDLFEKGSTELAESIVGYTSERNKIYREAAEKMEDSDKKEQLTKILDQIDLAYSLDNLKEFAKTCKVKSFELEKPNKVYNSFLLKYENSSYNIYNLDLCRPILCRNLNLDVKYVDLFLIVFCKFCKNMRPDVVEQHAFMYYTIYNIVLVDMNKSENTKNISDEFLANVKKVITNSIVRNNIK